MAMTDEDINNMRVQIELTKLNKSNTAVTLAQAVLGVSLDDVVELLDEIERLRDINTTNARAFASIIGDKEIAC